MIPDPASSLSTVRGEFTNPQTERDYRADAQTLTARQLRLALRVWAALVMAFALPEMLALAGGGDAGDQGLRWLLAYRVGMALLLLAAVVWVGHRPALATGGRLAMVLGLLGYPMFFMLYAVRPDQSVWNLVMLMFVQLSLFLFLPGRVVLAKWVALWGLAGSIATLAWLGRPTDVLVGAALMLTMPAVVGYGTAARLQLMARREFLWRRSLMATNTALQNEVSRRSALEQELLRQAVTDPLTGLDNRREFERRFDDEAARARRGGGGFCIALVDLDHFKQINDTHGHAAGDEVLRHVAALCRESFRGVDAVARVGGEEFAILLHGAAPSSAAEVMQRFIDTLAARPVGLAGGKTVRVTATAGIALWAAADPRLDAVLQRADAALYAGKRAGRNRVVLDEAPPQ